MAIVKEEMIARLLEARVVEVTPSGCHIWTGGLNGHGYGVARFDGRKNVRVHRLAWEAANGPIPDGMGLMHSCDVRCCVNPNHLTPATQADNLKDMFAKGRGRIPDVRGERQGSAKLTQDDVRKIRAMDGSVPRKKIAAIFNVDVSNVGLIIDMRPCLSAADQADV